MCLILLRALLKQSLLFRLDLSEMFGAASTRARILVLNLRVNGPCNGFYPLFSSRRMLMNPNNLIVAHLDPAIVSC